MMTVRGLLLCLVFDFTEAPAFGYSSQPCWPSFPSNGTFFQCMKIWPVMFITCRVRVWLGKSVILVVFMWQYVLIWWAWQFFVLIEKLLLISETSSCSPFLAKLSLSPLDLVMVLWDNRMNWKMQVLFLFFRFYLGTKRGEKSGLFIYFIFIYFYFLFIFFVVLFFIFIYFLFYFLFIYFSFFFIYLFNFFKLFILYFYLFFVFIFFKLMLFCFWQCLLQWVLKHHNSCSMNRLWCR